jgi:bacteriorhodopsin
MESAVFALATLAFIVGALGIAHEGRRRTSVERARTGLYLFAAVAAAVAYGLMANGAGTVTAAGGLVRIPRHLLWVAVAPSLLVALALAAFPAGRSGGSAGLRQQESGLVVALAIAGAAGFAALGIAALTDGVTRAIWLAAAIFSLLAAAGVVWLPLRQLAAEGGRARREIFDALAGASTVLVAVLPLAFLLGPNGAGLLGEATTTVILAVADVGLVVGTGLLAVWSARHLPSVEAGERGEAPATAARVFAPSPQPRGTAQFAAARLGAIAREFQPRSAGQPDPREEVVRRLRQEWEGARERLLARGRGWRTARSGAARTFGPRAQGWPAAGAPPRRLIVRGVPYALVGPATRGSPAGGDAPRLGQPIRPGAAPPQEIALGGYRYRRPEAPPASSHAGPRYGWRTGALAPSRPPSASAAEPPPRPGPPARPRLRRAAPPSRPFLSLANLPLRQIPPESAVPVAIVAGVLLWVSRPRRRG